MDLIFSWPVEANRGAGWPGHIRGETQKQEGVEHGHKFRSQAGDGSRGNQHSNTEADEDGR